jgi:hypothetical protein
MQPLMPTPVEPLMFRNTPAHTDKLNTWPLHR